MLNFELQLWGSPKGTEAPEYIDTVHGETGNPTQEEINYMIDQYKMAFNDGWDFFLTPVVVPEEVSHG